MRLTQFTDNALRCLMFLALREDESVVPIPEIARTMSISEDHLGKIVQRLVRLGYVQTSRGRTGGVRLAKAPAQINIGRLVRDTEESFNLVACFFEEEHTCPIAPACRLAGLLDEGLKAFLHVLDQKTLEDVVADRAPLARALRDQGRRATVLEGHVERPSATVGGVYPGA